MSHLTFSHRFQCWEVGRWIRCGYLKRNGTKGRFYDKTSLIWFSVWNSLNSMKEKLMKSRIFISGSRRPRYSTDGVFKPLICIRPHLNSLGWLHLVTHSVCQFVHTECPPKFHRKEPRRLPARQRPPVPGTRRGRGGGGNPTPSTSTRSSSRSTLTLVYPARPCPSWTLSWMTSLSALLLKLPVLPTTTGDQLSPAERSRLLSVSSCPVSWPSTPYLREPRPWPSTPAPSKHWVYPSTIHSVLSGPPHPPKEKYFLKKLLLLSCTVIINQMQLKIESFQDHPKIDLSIHKNPNIPCSCYQFKYNVIKDKWLLSRPSDWRLFSMEC